MTTPLEKSHRELYEALEQFMRADKDHILLIEASIEARIALQNAEKIIK